MTEQYEWRRDMEDRVFDEVKFIVEAFKGREKPIDIGVRPQDTGLGYLYAEGQLLVLERYLEAVLASLRRQGVAVEPPPGEREQGEREQGERQQETPPDEPPQGGAPDDESPRPEYPGDLFPRILPGLILLHISGGSVLDVLDVIDRELGVGCATPNHVLTVADEVGPCSATDPQEVYKGTEPYPGICHGNSGAGVRVYISDTGLLADAASGHPWLAGVEGDPDPLSPGLQSGKVKPYAGHGTFVAGVLRCIAPATEIYVGNVFKTGGSALETDFVLDLQRAMQEWHPDIYHLSAASTTRKSLALLSFWTWLKQLRKHQGIVCVAPSGNSGSRRPHWPAASPEVASVGALAADWRSRASFSNYGGWVDAYAPGRNLINAFAFGPYSCDMYPYSGQVRQFYGMAQWSGTSFSSPIVTGLIADRMWRTGEDGIEAAAAVLRTARCHAIPGVGAIALPCGEDRGCRCGEDRGCGNDRGCGSGSAPHRPGR